MLVKMPTDFNIRDIVENVYASNGIYYARNNRPISYPEKGNQDCLQLEEHSFWFKHRNNCIRHLVTKFSLGKIFWDIGGGNGFVSRHLQTAGIESVLLEPGENGALNGKNRGLKYVLCGTLEDIGLKSGKIEAAGMFDVLEHIEDDHQFLKKLNIACSEDAHVYITVPAFHVLWSNEDEDAGHFRRYTLKRLAAVLDNCGFKVVYSSYLFSFLPLPILLFRSLPSRLGLNNNASKMEKYSKEHEAFKLSSLLDTIMKWEETRVSHLKRIPIGGSCLVVATVDRSKKSTTGKL